MDKIIKILQHMATGIYPCTTHTQHTSISSNY